MESTARNEVLLVGRLAAAPEERVLPSGDVITTFRLVVDRTGPRRPSAGRTVTIDSLECIGWTAAARRSAATLSAGDVLEVRGALRRRFWRGRSGPASRYEVEVERLKRLAKAPKAA
jgi:single-strand DNA-binding protein